MRRWARFGFAVGVVAGGGLLAACDPPPPVLQLAVTTTIDGLDAQPGDGVCEVTPGAGDCSLRAAVDEANAAATEVQVQVPAGDYVLTEPGGDDDNTGGDLDVGAAGGKVVVLASAPGATIDAAGADGAIDVRAGSVQFWGFEVTGAAGPGAVVRAGAHGDLVLDTFHDNGVGVVVDAGGSAMLHDATVAANGGAGVDNDGTLLARFTTVTANGGGGVAGSGVTTAQATAVAQQAGGADCVAPMTLSSEASSDSDGSCSLSGPGDLPAASTALGALTSEPSGLPVARPEAGSDLVDAIAPGVSVCGDGAVDQTGRHRPVGSGCDIGAIEADFALHLVVDDPSDAGDAAVGDGVCDAGGGTCTLRAAVDEVNGHAVPGFPSTIELVVDPTLALAGASEDANATGDLDLLAPVSLVGAGHRVDAAGLDRVLDVRSDGVTIEDVTVTGGHVVAEDGGGIRHTAGSLVIRRAVVDGNESQPEATPAPLSSSTSRGGGLSAEGTHVEIEGTTFVGNVADNGGAILHRLGTMAVGDSTFSDNTGGAYVTPDSFSSVPSQGATFTHVTVSDRRGVTDRAGIASLTTTYCKGFFDCVIYPGGPVTVTASMFDTVYAGCQGVTAGGFNVGCGPPLANLDARATLAVLGDFGGPTPTQPSFAGGPGVDLIPPGTPGLCEPGSTDQRGEPRPIGAGCDSGAVEGDLGVVLTPLSLVVDSPVDARDADPADGECRTASGACTLRAAVDQANAWPSADTVTIAAGVAPVLSLVGAGEDGNATGDLDVWDDLRLDGDGATVDGATLDRVFDSHRPAAPFDLDDVTIRRGRANDGPGGAVRSVAAVSVTGSHLVDNRATGVGGAVSGRTVALVDAELRDNRATGNGGGADAWSTLTVTDSLLAANSSAGSGGGVSGGVLAIDGGTFEANSALSGGGAYAGVGGSTITDATFRSNTAALGGGGIATRFSATVLRSTIEGNRATDATYGTGGGIQAKADLTVRESTIAANTAAVVGGGIATQAGTLTLTASTVDANVAGTNGGAIQLLGPATIRRATITDNRLTGSGPGAGIASPSAYPAVTVGGSVLANVGYDCWAVTPTSVGGNVARNCLPLGDATDQHGVDPLLGPLGDHGGPTATRLPFAGSPVLDVIAPGTAGLCDASSPTDQRGGARPAGAGCDAGAVEGAGGPSPAPTTFTVDTPVDAVDADPTDGTCATASATCSLRAAVTEANAKPGPDTVVIGSGIDPVLTRAGLLEVGNQAGDLDVYGDTTIEGGGATIHATAGDRAFLVLGADLHLHDVTVEGPGPSGFALWAGALAYVQDGSIELVRSTVTGATTGDPAIGGRLAAVRLEDATVRDGTAGGIEADQGTLEVELVRSTVSGFGGDPIDAPIVDLTASTVADNGGALRAAGGTWTAATVAGNVGGVAVTGAVVTTGSILDGVITCGPALTSGGYNLSRGGCGLSGGSDVVTTDVLLAPLADNGGPTRTRLPYANSPAVDSVPTGTPVLCAGGATDQRGVVRPVAADCDRGAVEGDTGAALLPLTLVVDTAADAVDTNPGDGVCTAAGGGCSLRAAIDEANAHPGGDAVTVAAGVNPTLSLAGPDEDANATGDLDVTGAVSITGTGATVVSAAQLDRVLDLHGGPVVLERLTVRDGRLTAIGSRGGAIRATAVDLVLDRATVRSSRTGTDGIGGGIVLEGGSLLARAATVAGNVAPGSGTGGGVAALGAVVELRTSTVSGNQAAAGSAVAALSGGSTTAIGSTIVASAGYRALQGPTTLGGTVVSVTGALACDGSVTSLGHNLVSDTSCGLAGTGDLAGVAPLLGVLTGNGGTTLTHRPGVGSPAIDAIPAGTAGLCDASTATDQRGVARPQGAACDIGSVEQ